MAVMMRESGFKEQTDSSCLPSSPQLSAGGVALDVHVRLMALILPKKYFCKTFRDHHLSYLNRAYLNGVYICVNYRQSPHFKDFSLALFWPAGQP